MPTSSLINVAGHHSCGSNMMNMAGLLFSYAAEVENGYEAVLASKQLEKKDGDTEKGEGREREKLRKISRNFHFKNVARYQSIECACYQEAGKIQRK
jgi:hypothetical protein